MENERLLHLFGLARRGGRLERGFDAAESAMRSSTARAVYIACDLSERTERNVRRIASETGCALWRLEASMAELGHAIGCKPTGVLALTDKGFAAAVRKLLPAPQQDDTED